ncbi:glycosyltransferase [Candidatus Binatus sp.]|uniref:glycosyltransferase family 2 protein n=1 Tax=Candidatus Binatus sp. TaxID=2811406 RepID=UPI002FB4F158
MIIPVFNGERTVARAIESALAQEFDGEIEVIVVNDGSTDATATVRAGGNRMRSCAEPALKDRQAPGCMSEQPIGVEDAHRVADAFAGAAAQPVGSAGTRLAGSPAMSRK